MAGHLVDIMVALMGAPIDVHPILRKHYGRRREVDNAVVVHEFESGLGTIDAAGMEIGMARRIEVHGTRGTAIHSPIGSPDLDLCLESASEGYREGWQSLTLERSKPPLSAARDDGLHPRRKGAGLQPGTRPDGAARALHRLRHRGESRIKKGRPDAETGC